MAAGVTGYASTVMGTPLGEMAIVVSERGVLWTMFTEDGARKRPKPAARPTNRHFMAS